MRVRHARVENAAALHAEWRRRGPVQATSRARCPVPREAISTRYAAHVTSLNVHVRYRRGDHGRDVGQISVAQESTAVGAYVNVIF